MQRRSGKAAVHGHSGAPSMESTGAVWPDARLGAVVMALSALALGIAGEPGLTVQLWLLLAGVTIFGLPHGALDHRLAELLLSRPMGPGGILLFLTLYGLLSMLVVGSWLLSPDVTLALFLAVAWLHFGLGDASDGPSSAQGNARVRMVQVLARGGAILMVPTLTHPQEVASIFAALGAADGDRFAAAWAGGGGAVWGASLIAWLAEGAMRPVPGWAWEVAEVATIAVAATLAPPLLAFCLYFCLLHSPRHLSEVAGWTRAGWIRTMRDALPLTLGAWALGALAWPWLVQVGTEAGMMRLVFWGLAAFTLPHMLLASAAQYRCR